MLDQEIIHHTKPQRYVGHTEACRTDAGRPDKTTSGGRTEREEEEEEEQEEEVEEEGEGGRGGE